ncbi:helix-turn-helix domain-containing protein [Rhodobacteraceae bacterium M385]|nr:helix-turn-helix domain-containing protein [Rhodobacteraceae bacterium M385]
MAPRHNEWAFEIANHHDLKMGQRLVLLALAHHRNKSTGKCYPSLETLAKLSNLDRRTVQRHLKSLRDNGVITIEERFHSNRQLSNLYGFPLLN